jgi:hypothetical protein
MRTQTSLDKPSGILLVFVLIVHLLFFVLEALMDAATSPYHFDFSFG